MIAPQLDLLSAPPEWSALAGDKPGLGAWLDRMRARPSFQATTLERLQATLAAAG